MINQTGRAEHHLTHLGAWTGAWVISMAVATFGPNFIWDLQALTVIAVLINFIIGIGMILANIRHLRGLDELMRRIQLEAMGLSLGIGIVLGLSYSLLDITDVITTDAEISYLVILITLVYIVSLMINKRRYQ